MDDPPEMSLNFIRRPWGFVKGQAVLNHDHDVIKLIFGSLGGLSLPRNQATPSAFQKRRDCIPADPIAIHILTSE